MGQVLGVNHIGVSVRDLAASRAFWVALGFGEHLEFAWPPGTAAADEALGLSGSAAEVVVLHAPASYLELFAFSAPVPVPRAPSCPGVAEVEVAVDDLAAATSALHGLGWALEATDAGGGTVRTHCPDGTPVTLRVGGPAGLALVRVRVPDPTRSALASLAPTDGVGLVPVSGADTVPAAPCDLGANHVCLDVTGITDVRERLGEDVRWHHGITASSGGIASVCYGTTHDGVVVELLESHSPDAALSRTRLVVA